MGDDNIPTLISVKPLKPEHSHLQKIALTTEEFTIGRGIGSSAVIPYLSISRFHCVFKKSENNDWYLQDFSSYGISVNDKKLEKGSQVTITDGDIINFEPCKEFVYKFSRSNEDFEIPKKRIKIKEEPDSCILDNVKMKFEESQKYEIKHIKEKIENAKHLQQSSIILKEQLQANMDRKIQLLQNDFAQQIENLRGEKNEIERQKSLLIEERNAQLANVKNEMEGKITMLLGEIEKHNENESELLQENNLLKEKLDKEREEFLAELNRESSSKKDMLEKLEAKIREQEEVRLKEKQELEETLKKETDQLRLAQEKELKEIAEQKRLRELELEQEMANIKQKLQEKVEQTEQQKRETEQLFNMKMEQLQKLSDKEKIKMEQLQKEREEIQNQLLEAKQKAELSLAELQRREIELAKLESVKLAQEEQSNEVVSLQEQLEQMKSALQSLETEKQSLLRAYIDGAGEGTSKQNTFPETELESELTCSICAELFIEATTLNCAHSFCKYCITMWMKKKRDCPICRAPITAYNRSIVLDTIINKSQSLTEELQHKREEILKARAEEASTRRQTSRATATRSRTTAGARRARGRGRATTTSSGGSSTSLARTSVATVDLTTLPMPTSWTERPPVLAPPAAVRVYRPRRDHLEHSSLFFYPEIIDLTTEPTQISRLERPTAARPRAVETFEVGPLLVAESVVVETSPASSARTTAATGAASTAARADTGPPAAPSDSVLHVPTTN